MSTKHLRIGQIGYLNVLPLFHHLKRIFPPSDGLVYIPGHPSEMNALLARGELDCAPASSFEYLSGAGRYRLLPELSISAPQGPVKSVLLVSPVALEELPAWLAANGPKVGLTGASASSVALLKVLWTLCWNLPEARWAPMAPGSGLAGRRPFLEIGNLALKIHVDRPAGWHVIDLAEHWRRWTGLPFVFAVWIVRRGLSPAQQALLGEVHTALLHCKTTCVQAIAEIARWEEFKPWISPAGIEDYLATMGYDLGPEEQASLTLFGTHCTTLGLIDGMPALTWAL